MAVRTAGADPEDGPPARSVRAATKPPSRFSAMRCSMTERGVGVSLVVGAARQRTAGALEDAGIREAAMGTRTPQLEILPIALDAALPPAQGLYDPRREKDSCGVGFIADMKNRKSHGIIAQGLKILHNLDHRGA